MDEYLGLVDNVLRQGEQRGDRTETGVISKFGETFHHDMSEGFPLVTTKAVKYPLVAIELNGFIQGKTDKRWYSNRGCHIWDPWARRDFIPYDSDDEETKEIMRQEPDLGPIYGWQWRHAGAEYRGCEVDYGDEGVDQLENLIEKIEKDPQSRRQKVEAWNPSDLHKMALPPCHTGFQTYVNQDGTMDLLWQQRSVDLMIGLPFNTASYATLLNLLCEETSHEPGELIGHFGDTHVYESHVEKAKEQLSREPRDLPSWHVDDFTSIFDWSYDDSYVEDYNPHSKINYTVAV